MVKSWTVDSVREPLGVEQTTEYKRGGPRTFALEVQGESMIGTEYAFFPGELVHIDPDQVEPEAGAYVLAELTDTGRHVFKQLKYEDGKFYLSPLNRHFAPIFEPFKILGRAVAKTVDL